MGRPSSTRTLRSVAPKSAGEIPLNRRSTIPETDLQTLRSPWEGAARNGVCPDCLREVHDSAHPRYRYPFAGCAECGPGYTITLRLPYERANTTMAPFQMCADCQAEFENPSSRHHGSPLVCCPRCGPSYWIEPAPAPHDPGDVVQEVADLLRDGHIVALKDTCSFRLLARAADGATLLRMRARIDSPSAPFGILALDLDQAGSIAELEGLSGDLLQSASAPRVLLPLKPGAPISELVVPETSEIGVLLPRVVFHHLLLEELGEPLAFTTAKRSGDPMVLTNEEARERLMDIADYLVMHDLDLHAGCQDSILRPESSGVVVLRRSSGLAPSPIAVREELPATLALGGRHEATLALAQGNRIYLSQHLGDVDSRESRRAYERALQRMVELWACQPQSVVVEEGELGFSRSIAAGFDAEILEVSHHHAHVASVLAEHQRTDRVLGVSLDSTHYQFDEKLGSGEFLLADAVSSEVVERVPAFRVPGDEAAIRAPWRTALGLIHDLLGRETAVTWAVAHVGDTAAVRSAISMLDNDSGCRRVTSFGRLYDAAAAITGICTRSAGPGEATARLQGLAGRPRETSDRFLEEVAAGRVDLRGVFAEILERARVRPRAEQLPALAAWVETALARWAARRAFRLARRHELGTVAAAGGCLVDPWLRTEFQALASREGLEVLLNSDIPPGDGGLALGQLWVGAHRVLRPSPPA